MYPSPLTAPPLFLSLPVLLLLLPLPRKAVVPLFHTRCIAELSAAPAEEWDDDDFMLEASEETDAWRERFPRAGRAGEGGGRTTC